MTTIEHRCNLPEWETTDEREIYRKESIGGYSYRNAYVVGKVIEQRCKTCGMRNIIRSVWGT